MRVGQKNKLTYRWARKGSRPRATHDQRTQSTYLFGAGCPEHVTGPAPALSAGNSLKFPRNISLLPLPPRSPELNPQENIWQYMRQNWLSNRVFKSFDEIVDHCCFAWNTLIDQPSKIMSIYVPLR